MNEETLFQEALAKSPAERAAFLDAACAGQPQLRAAVAALLATHEKSGYVSEKQPADLGQTIDSEPGAPDHGATAAHTPEPEEAPVLHVIQPNRSSEIGLGTVIAGRYILIDVIGEGGMGSVYLASQTEPVKRKVALKLIKSGMDSKAVLARFDAERQALAVMDHPNIARVYDGGTTLSGQPFFVMELVQGIPLTQFCDSKRLSVEARLELFVAVCKAVQHAHQKGIIHRDLKPGNVLVTEVDGRPTPKVIDFGVAKATELKLTEMSFSDVGTIVGTPVYMSPEQADPTSMDIDTRTDVYSLGVMLYELLVGSPPIDAKQFKRGAIVEMLRMVRDVEPPRPSTKLSTAADLPTIAARRSIEPAKLAKSLQGELDWVVMKALEKDRARRYETANSLARDIQRYLADELVEARPPSAGYRLKKFVRRHKGQVIASGLVLFALLAGIVGTTLGLIEAKRQEQIAIGNELEAKRQEKIAIENEQKARASEKIAADQAELALNTLGLLINKVQAQLGKQPGAHQLKLDLLQTAMNGLKQVTGGPAGKMRRNTGDAFFRMGAIARELGNTADAYKYWQQYYEMAQSALKDTPDNERLQLEMAWACRFLGEISVELGDLRKALDYYQSALALRQQLAAVPRRERMRRNEKLAEEDRLTPRLNDLQLSEEYTRVGLIHYFLGDSAQAEKPVLTSLALRENLLNETARDQTAFFMTVNPAALPTVLSVVAAVPSQVEQVNDLRQNLTRNYHLVGEIYFRLRDLNRSRVYYQKCEETREAILREDENGVELLKKIGKPRPPDFRLMADLAEFHQMYGAMLFSLGAPLPEALPHIDRSIALSRKVLEIDKAVGPRQNLAKALYSRGVVAARAGDDTLAVRCFQECFEIREELADKDVRSYRKKVDLLEVLARVGRYERAAQLAEKLRLDHQNDSEFLICATRCYAQCSLAVLDQPSARAQYVKMALAALQNALEGGYKDIVTLETHPDLDPIRENPVFTKLMEKVSKTPSLTP
ncbi:MAG TPA: serine/threonine-protein kinase [Gemmataceae bacterium]|nr:serine/threonine-protein kinase [Gemmataceae bacterium]